MMGTPSRPSTCFRDRTAPGTPRSGAAVRRLITPAADPLLSVPWSGHVPAAHLRPWLRSTIETFMLLQQLVNGLTLGAIYTLLALSFSIVMGVLGILNLAIAELFM